MRKLTRAWTANDTRILIDALDADLSPARAAVKLKRTVKAVQSKARIIGRPFKTIRERRRETFPPAVPVGQVLPGSDNEARLAAIFKTTAR